MKINYFYDLCSFICDTVNCTAGDCPNCPLNGHGSTLLKGELELFKECDHKWEYSQTYNMTTKYVDRFSKFCSTCNKRHEIMVDNISQKQIKELFGD